MLINLLVLCSLLAIPPAVAAQVTSEASDVKCDGALSAGFAKTFVNEWIAAWNSHDMDRILAHYADDFEMLSPGIIATAGEPSGILRGKAKIRTYWEAALKAQPDLKFELIGVYAGIASVAIHYRTAAGRTVVEIAEFNSACKVIRGSAIRGVIP